MKADLLTRQGDLLSAYHLLSTAVSVVTDAKSNEIPEELLERQDNIMELLLVATPPQSQLRRMGLH